MAKVTEKNFAALTVRVWRAFQRAEKLRKANKPADVARLNLFNACQALRKNVLGY